LPYSALLDFKISVLAKHRVTSEYLVAKIGVDTEENEPLKVSVSIHSLFNPLLNPQQLKSSGPSIARAGRGGAGIDYSFEEENEKNDCTHPKM
jgi:hypothetical protein